MEDVPTVYLGDGVYASFDGYHIQLHVGSHLAPPCVALEPEVLKALVDYSNEINARVVRKVELWQAGSSSGD